MPQTYDDYLTVEVALAIKDNLDLASGHERTQEGDIVAARRILGWVGMKERSQFLWLRIEGLDVYELMGLTEIFRETEDGPAFEKRRYCIPFNRLPNYINLARVRDENDIYQPFLPLDEDDNTYLLGPSARSLNISGLVFDKKTGTYL